MRFVPLLIHGAFEIQIEPKKDHRGFFSRVFCEKQFAEHSLATRYVQHNLSANTHKGTLRGLHFQKHPFEEAKVVSCIKGKVFDVIVDLRRHSSSFGKWQSLQLDSSEFNSVYVPPGCAHGFQTLINDSVVHYLMSESFNPESADGIHWRDPFLNISWPLGDQAIISDKDEALSFFEDFDQ